MSSPGRESGLAQRPNPRRLGWEVLRLAVRPHRRIGALGLAAGVLWSAGKLAVPALIAHTINTGIADDRIGSVIGDSLVIAAVGAAGAFAAALRRWWAQRLGFLVERDIRARLVRHAYRLHLGFHAEVASGVLVSRTSSDLLQIQQPFIMIPLLFSGLVMLLGAIALLSLVSVPLMLVSLSPSVLILVVSVRFTGRLGPQSQAVQRELAATSAEVGEAFTGMASIKGLGAEQAALAALQARTTRVFDATMGLARLRASHLPFFDFLPTIGLVGTLWYGSTLVEQGAITVGALVQANAYILLLSNPLRMVGTTIAQLQRALVSATLIGEIVSVEPAITDPPHPVPLGAVRGEVRFENIALSPAHHRSDPVAGDALQPGAVRRRRPAQGVRRAGHPDGSSRGGRRGPRWPDSGAARRPLPLRRRGERRPRRCQRGDQAGGDPRAGGTHRRRQDHPR